MERHDQIDLFAATYEKPEGLPKHIRLIEFFAGIGAQAKALEILNADFEHWRTCEWSWQSIIAYNAIHIKTTEDYSKPFPYNEILNAIRGVSHDYNKPMTEKQLRGRGEEWARKVYNAMIGNNNFCPDVSKLHAEDLGIEDREHNTYVLTYSFPCVCADELVLTKERGYIPFIEAKPGLHVLAKDGQWHEIAKFFDNGTKETVFIEGQGFASIHCTPDHKIWVRTKYRKGHEGRRSFTEPEWVKAKDLTTNHYFGVPVIKEEIPFFTDDLLFWELIGSYIGDGWLHQGAAFISGNKKKTERTKAVLEALGYKYSIYHDDENCWRVRIAEKSLVAFIDGTVGTGSKTKSIPFSFLALPKPQLKALFEGYVKADGCKLGNKTQITTTNKNLAYSFSLIINKLFHRVCQVYEIKTAPTHVIEGREVNQSNWYQLRFKETNSKQDKAFYEEGYIWFPFKKRYKGETERVYDIEVAEDHSFTLNGCLISNCQDLSAAGLGKGMEKGKGTRSGLLWEVERILLECKAADCLPQVLIMENVPQVIGSNNVNDFNLWLKALEEMGYTNYHKVLNAADYSIPQNRNRCFMVSILGEFSFHFPKKQELRYLLRDFKEKKVDEYYYLSDELVASFQAQVENATKGEHYSQSPSNNGLFSSAEEGEGNSLSPEKARPEEEVSTPLELHIPSATKKGYMEAEEGDGILPHWKGARGTVQKGMIPTLLTSAEHIGVVCYEKDESSGEPK